MGIGRLVCSYPPALGDWERRALDRPAFRSYLRRVHDTASEGETWSEFVGSCGDTIDVSLRIERVEGSGELDEETTIEFVERAAAPADGVAE